MKRYIILAFWCCISIICKAQSQKSDSLFSLGVELYNNQQYEKAIPMFAQCDSLDKVELDSTNNRRGYAAMWLASCYYQLGDSITAMKKDSIYYKFTPINRRLTVESDSLSRVGIYLYLKGNYVDALQYLRRCADIEKSVLGDKHVWYGNSIVNMARLYYKLNDTINTIKYLKEYAGIILYNYGCISNEYKKALIELNFAYKTFLGNKSPILTLQANIEIRAKILGTENLDYAESLLDLAAYKSKLGNHVEAVYLGEQSLEIFEKIFGTEHSAYANLLSNIALEQYYSGNYTEAIRLGKHAKDIQAKMLGTEHPAYATSLNNLALYHSNLGNYAEAVHLAEQSLEIYRKKFDTEHPVYDIILTNYTIILNYLALSKWRLGNYYEAVCIVKQALEIDGKRGIEHSDYARSLNHLAYFLYELGNYAEAIQFGEQAMKICGKVFGTDNHDYAVILANLSNYHSSLGNHTEALQFAMQSLEIEGKFGTETQDYANFLNRLAIIQCRLGNITEAIRLGKQVLDINRKNLGTEHPDYAISLINLALYQNDIGNYSEAAYLGQQSMQISKKVCGIWHPDYANTLEKNALFSYNVKDKIAIGHYSCLNTNVVSNIIMTQFSFLTSNERATFWKNKYSNWYTKDLPKYTYTYPTDTLCFTAYNGALLSKGLILNSEIEMRKLLHESGDAEIDSLYDEMHLNKLQLQRLYEKPIAERYISTDSLESVVNKQEQQLMQKSKVYGDYTKNLRINWKDVQGKLTDKDVAIEFVSFPLNNDSMMYMALVLKKGMEYPKMVRLFEEKQLKEIRKKYDGRETASLVWKPLALYINNMKNIYFGASGELYNVAIEQVPHWGEDCLMSDKWNIYRLSSTRELALIKDRNAVKQAAVYGGIRYDAGTELLANDSRRFGGKRDMSMELFDIADSLNIRSGVNYLPGTKTEAENIYKTLKQKHITATLKMDTLATEGAFKDLSGRKNNLLHITTHGFYWTEREVSMMRDLDFLMFGDVRPRYVEDKALTRSGLLMAGANNALMGKKLPEGVNDGILTAKEIAQLDLRGLDLVVMAACQTGLGEITGDGVFGLQRGFKKAGANTLMMSLWKVDDDATQMLMTQFYKNLTAGKSKYESLRLAQKYVREYEKEVEVRSDERPKWSANAKEQARKEAQKENRKIRPFQAPEYWAAFILMDAVD